MQLLGHTGKFCAMANKGWKFFSSINKYLNGNLYLNSDNR